MKFTPNNFLEFVKQIVCGGGPATTGSTLNDAGGGFLQDYNLGLNGGALSGGALSTVNNTQIVNLPASSTTVGTWNFLVPRDYDQQVDTFIVRVLANMGGATDTPTLTVASSTTAINSSTVGVAGTSKTSAALNTKVQAFEFNLSAQKLVRDEIVSLMLTTSAHATNAVQIFAVEVVYASTLVSWGKDGDVDALGVPLRG